MRLVIAFLVGVVLGLAIPSALAQETPSGKGMTEANQEQLVLEDGEDVSDCYNGSPEETKISASDKHVKQGGKALLFANVVDHTKGEKNYPIGWPRAGKDLAKLRLTDWSNYDAFECWIHVETSRDALPAKPLSVGFYHSGSKQSTSFPLSQVAKDQWVKIAIPVERILKPADVQRVQFSIAEAEYRDGDRVDFHLDQIVLTRYVEPAIKQVTVDRNLCYSSERSLTVAYDLVGHQGMEQTSVELEVGIAKGEPFVKTSGKASRQGELVLGLPKTLPPGTCWARISLRDAGGRLIDRKQVEFRVIAGPF